MLDAALADILHPLSHHLRRQIARRIKRFGSF